MSYIYPTQHKLRKGRQKSKRKSSFLPAYVLLPGALSPLWGLLSFLHDDIGGSHTLQERNGLLPRCNIGLENAIG